MLYRSLLPIVLTLIVVVPASAGARCKPQPRVRVNLVQLNEEPGLRVLRPARSWGNALLVDGIRRLAAAHRASFPDAPPLWIHDVSRQGGGRIPGHCSHRTGQDVDIRLPLRDPAAGYVDATPGTLDLERAWFLLLGLAATCDVELIFLDRELQQALYGDGRRHLIWRRHLKYLLQYPFRRASGVVRHRDHHKNHMHVRFRRPGVELDLHGARMLCSTVPEDVPNPTGASLLVEKLLVEHLDRMGRHPP
jgi:hypothetical protein